MSVPITVPCVLYTPGHQTHYIQATRPPFGPERPCVILAAHADGTIDVETDDGPVSLWHHDPTRLTAIIAEHGERPISYFPQRGMLKFLRPEGSPVVCVARADQGRTPCLATPTGTSLLEQILETGGFLGRVVVTDDGGD